MFSLSKKRRKFGDFWQWLGANTTRIQAGVREGGSGVMDEISEPFKESYPDLTWEVTLSETGPWVFCISADGTRELFEQVRAAVAAAPHIPGWKIVAFRQRGSLEATINMDGRELGYHDIWCAVEPVGTQARVTLYVRGLTMDAAEPMVYATLVLLDNAVGEYDAVMKIIDLNTLPLSIPPTKSDTFFSLAELSAYLDRLGG